MPTISTKHYTFLFHDGNILAKYVILVVFP